MDRRKAIITYLSGTLGQIVVAVIMVCLLRNARQQMDYSTPLGLMAIAIGGLSSALWGAIISVKYLKKSPKTIFLDFFNIKQSYQGYLLILLFLLPIFGGILWGGKIHLEHWYTPIVLFLTAILFGGIEEIGWRYTFQPVLEEKMHFISSTLITFVCWSVWHTLFFYIDGTLNRLHAIDFFSMLLTLCFLLSALYSYTKSLWLCVMTHALFNMFSSLMTVENLYVSYVGRIIVVILAIIITYKSKRK